MEREKIEKGERWKYKPTDKNQEDVYINVKFTVCRKLMNVQLNFVTDNEWKNLYSLLFL